jgi:hypothetical protein
VQKWLKIKNINLKIPIVKRSRDFFELTFSLQSSLKVPPLEEFREAFFWSMSNISKFSSGFRLFVVVLQASGFILACL